MVDMVVADTARKPIQDRQLCSQRCSQLYKQPLANTIVDRWPREKPQEGPEVSRDVLGRPGSTGSVGW